MDLIQIYSSNGLHIAVDRQNLPGQDKQLTTTVQHFKAIEKTNEFIFQEMQGNGFTIRLHNLLIREPAAFTICTGPTISLLLSMERSAGFELDGHGAILLPERRFNLISTPSFKASFDTDRKMYQLLEISFSAKMLQPYADKYPALKRFLQQVESGIASRLFDNNQLAESDMLILVSLITGWEKSSQPDPDWLGVYVTELLQLALSRGTFHTVKHLDTTVINRLYDVKEVLEDALDNNMQINWMAANIGLSYEMQQQVMQLRGKPEYKWPAKDLSDYAGIPARQLNKAFKEIFGHSMAAFRQEHRWVSVITMLCGQNAKISSLSRMLGYRDQQKFIAAFTEKYGCSPQGYLKKMKKELKDYKKMVATK